jgi:hypothetical protein
MVGIRSTPTCRDTLAAIDPDSSQARTELAITLSVARQQNSSRLQIKALTDAAIPDWMQVEFRNSRRRSNPFVTAVMPQSSSMDSEPLKC